MVQKNRNPCLHERANVVQSAKLLAAKEKAINQTKRNKVLWFALPTVMLRTRNPLRQAAQRLTNTTERKKTETQDIASQRRTKPPPDLHALCK